MKMHRCWCRNTWPVLLGPHCMACGRIAVSTFTPEHIAPGIVDEHVEGGGTVRMIDLRKARPGVYDEAFIGKMEGPEWEAWCAKMGV